MSLARLKIRWIVRWFQALEAQEHGIATLPTAPSASQGTVVAGSGSDRWRFAGDGRWRMPYAMPVILMMMLVMVGV